MICCAEREKDYRIHAKRIKRLVFRPNEPIECNLNGEGTWHHGTIIQYREEEERSYDVAFSDESLPSTVEKIPGKLLRPIGDFSPLLHLLYLYIFIAFLEKGSGSLTIALSSRTPPPLLLLLPPPQQHQQRPPQEQN